VSGTPTPAAEKDKGDIPPATSALPDQDFHKTIPNKWDLTLIIKSYLV
jgi:hypothetical protein